MRLQTTLIVFLLLPAGAVRAQDIELQVELMNRVGTDSSRKGDLISGRVLSPQALQGDIVEGKVGNSRSGAKMGGKAVLSLSFDRLRHGGGSIEISTQIRSIANSKGQMNADEEGRIIRGTNNVPKAAAGTGAGALIGGLAGGGKGALIGAAAGAVVSLVLIDIAADGPNVRLDPGSRLTVMASSRGGPALQSLKANAAAAPAPPQPAAPATAAAPVPAIPAASPTSAAPANPAAAQQAANPASQATAPPPAASSQPDLTAVKSDFIPGDKTIFLDDFTDMAGDEPPPHWKVRGGTAELRTGQGVRQLTIKSGGAGLTPNLTALPKNFTMELEVKHNGHETVANWRFLAKTGREAMFFRTAVNYGKLDLYFKVGDETIANHQPITLSLDQPIKEALWIQNGRLRLYVNGQRLFDVNQIQLPDLGTPELKVDVPRQGVADNTPDPHIGFQLVRFAESAPDFSQMISSSGRYVTHGILFDTGSDRIKPDSAPVIRLIARGLETNPNLKLQIEGHTDSTGNADQNMDLSKRRAEAVKAVLVSQLNVDAGRLTTAGLGATKPIESNDTPTGRAQNRRVEFVRQ